MSRIFDAMIFISHTSSDRDFADHLVKDLSSLNFNLWYSTWEIKGGESITQRVQDALRESDCLIVILSKKSCRAPWVKREVNSYLFQQISSRKGRIIPIVIEQCKTSFFLSDMLQIRFYEDGYEAAFTRLVFELLQLDEAGHGQEVVDVFRRTHAHVRNLKQFIKRRAEIINDPREIKADYIVLNDRRRLDVLEDRSIKCRISLDILLCKPLWGDEDWKDTIFDNRDKHTIEDVGYNTNSDIIQQKDERSLSSLVVNWRPSKPMRRGKVYRHTYEFVVNNGFPDATDFWVHRRYQYPTLWTEFRLKCSCQIDRVIPCRPPYTFELVEPWEFIAYALRSKDIFAHLQANRKGFKVSLPSTDLSDGLLVVFLFPDWAKYHEKDRQEGSDKRNREFEQSWFVECEFRKEIGWAGFAT